MHQRQVGVWTVTNAKAHFSELAEKVKSQGPQTITRYGHPTVVPVSAEEWTRLSQRKGNSTEFLSKSPTAKSGLQVHRLGFLAGQFFIPDDVDRMGGVAIERTFNGEA